MLEFCKACRHCNVQLKQLNGKCFGSCHNPVNYKNTVEHTKLIQEKIINKDSDTCKELFKEHCEKIDALHIEFQKFTMYCSKRLEICQFFGNIHQFSNKTKINLYVPNRNGN